MAALRKSVVVRLVNIVNASQALFFTVFFNAHDQCTFVIFLYHIQGVLFLSDTYE